MLNRLHTIRIDWSKPILYDNRFNSKNYDEEIGLYLISTKYVRHGKLIEKYIYVGETINTFEARCEQHLGSDTKPASNWVSRIGTKYIRFGKIERVPNFVDDIKHFVLTIETSIIQSIIDDSMASLENIRQVKSWQIWYDLVIENVGFKGILPSYINTRDYYED
jgi:hypothetical protein